MTYKRTFITKTLIFISIKVVVICIISELLNKHNMHILSVINYKAFDSVEGDKLWTIMSSKGIPTHLITTIQKKYIWKTS